VLQLLWRPNVVDDFQRKQEMLVAGVLGSVGRLSTVQVKPDICRLLSMSAIRDRHNSTINTHRSRCERAGFVAMLAGHIPLLMTKVPYGHLSLAHKQSCTLLDWKL